MKYSNNPNPQINSIWVDMVVYIAFAFDLEMSNETSEPSERSEPSKNSELREASEPSVKIAIL